MGDTMAKTGFPGIGAPKCFENHAVNRKYEQRYSMGAIAVDKIPGGTLSQGSGQPPAVVKPVKQGASAKGKLSTCRFGV